MPYLRFRRLHSADQALRDRAIMRLSSGQQDGEKAPFSICECVNLRVAPSARAANSLLLLPPFPPAAERCAFTCVESIICVSVARPFPASSRNRFSHTPRRAQSDYRSSSVDHTRAGNSHQRQPLFSTCTMPLMTRRSSARSTPRTSVVRRGSIRFHCSSLSRNRFLRTIPIPFQKRIPPDCTAFVAYNETMWESDTLTVSPAAREIAQRLVSGAETWLCPPQWYRAVPAQPSRLRQWVGLPYDSAERPRAGGALA